MNHLWARTTSLIVGETAYVLTSRAAQGAQSMTDSDLEARQLSLDFGPEEHTSKPDRHVVRRTLLSVVVSNDFSVACPTQVTDETPRIRNEKSIYAPEVTLALQKYADALGW